MSLGLTHGRSSKEERVSAYYNKKIRDCWEEKDKIEKKVGVPVGAFMINSSIVRQEPPALTILARAVSVKRRAAISSLGSSKSLMSSVTVPTTTAVLPVLSPRCLTILERDTGGLMVLEATNLLRMVLQKLDSVLLERNLKSYWQTKNTISDAKKQHRDVRCCHLGGTYSHKKMLIKILAFRVLLTLFLDSASFIQVDALDEIIKVSQ